MKDVILHDKLFLQDLSDVIRRDEEAGEFLTMPADEALVWLTSHPGDVGDQFQSFLDQHGHRCIREVTLYWPTRPSLHQRGTFVLAKKAIAASERYLCIGQHGHRCIREAPLY